MRRPCYSRRVLVLATLASLAIATVLARRLGSRGRAGLAAVVLLVPAAFSLPATVPDEIEEIAASPGIRPPTAEIAAPFTLRGGAWPPRRDGYRLAVAAARVVPRTAQIGVADARMGSARRLAFALAPRLIVDEGRVDWLILDRREQADMGLEPRRSWRFGALRLVRP